MKVNKKQKTLRNQGSKAPRSTPRKRSRVQTGASRNQNLQGSVAAAYSTGNSGKAPKVTASFDSCRVIHRELLGNVSGAASAAFTVSSTFALNPGLSATFPWLSNMAQNWETYHFSKLRFCYYTRTGSNTAGSIIMAPDYDAADAAPVSEVVVSSFEDIQEDAPWKDICCTLRPNAMFPMGSKKFIRSGALANNQDIKTYDAGNFFVCVVDSGGAVPWGKVWVEYDVTFYTPQLQAAGSTFSSSGTIQGNGTQSQAALFGTDQTVTGGLGLTGAGNVMSWTNLVIGQEYCISAIATGTTFSVGLTEGVFVGITLKTPLATSFAVATGSCNIATVLATASAGSLTFAVTAVSITEFKVVMANIPSSDAGI